MYIWQNLINALSTVIEYPALSTEDFEGTNILLITEKYLF